MSKYVIEDIEILSDESSKEDSQEGYSDEENFNKENSDNQSHY